MDAKNNPDTKALDLAAFADEWELWDDLASTKTMRAAGRKRLPQFRAEHVEDYAVRLNTTHLYAGAHKAHADMVAKPFAKPVALTDSDDFADAIRDDADRCGCNLAGLAESYYGDAVARSISFLVVEFPNTGGAQDHGQERSGEVRPYFVHVPASRAREYREERLENGEAICTEFRWAEASVERDGFEQKEVHRIRRWFVETSDDGTKSKFWEVYRKLEERTPDGAEWVLEADGPIESDHIGLPVVRLKLDEKPPLAALADKNLEHWQISSERSSSRQIYAAPTLMIAGELGVKRHANGTMESEEVVVGPRAKIHLATGSDAKYVEVSGAAAEVLKQCLDDCRAEMEVLGVQPFLRQGSAAATATQERNDQNRSDSQVQQWIRALENALKRAFEFAYVWAKKEAPAEFGVNVFSDFSLDFLRDADTKVLFMAQAAGLITKRTLLDELIRRGYFAEGLDAEAELELALAEIVVSVGASEPPSDEDDEAEAEEDEAQPVVAGAAG